MADRDEPRPAPGDAAAEDFLFHLHRGAELLQDNRVHAAKAELEQALGLQPSDPKGQDLLGIVYFRLGLYPRAISIYERLIQDHPDAIEPRINLALCYLKTGQPAPARVELEKALEQNPHHTRAWGYLGLAYQRLGDVDRASRAFLAGGHEAMARRLMDLHRPAAPAAPPNPLPRTVVEVDPLAATMQLEGAVEAPFHAPEPPGPPPEDTAAATPPAPDVPAALAPLEAEMRRAAGEAAQALEQGGDFHRDSDLPRIPSGTWAAIEPGREDPSPHEITAAPFSQVPTRAAPVSPAGPPAHAPPAAEGLPQPSLGAVQPLRSAAFFAAGDAAPGSMATSLPPVGVRGSMLAQTAPADEAPPPRSATTPPPSSVPGFPAKAPDPPLGFARERLLVFPRNLPVAQHPSGLVLVQASNGFATRLDLILSLTASVEVPTRALRRRGRGRDLEEPLGGSSAPVHELGGRCELVLAPPAGQRLVPLALEEEPLYLREDALAGFEPLVAYENGRLPAGDGEAIPMVQLRGRSGCVVGALPERAAAIEIMAGRATIVRGASVLGWLGRVVPRALPPSEAPAGMRGFVAFSGEGMVIVDGR
jgi:uncharacterized protein (AIM24 family)